MEKFPSLVGMLIRLGVVSFLALYIFFLFSFKVFDIHFDKRELNYRLIFEHATGVEINTQLEMSGFNIGHVTAVKHIKHKGRTMAEVDVAINKKYMNVITDKAYFFIARRKFIGLTFIQIIPDLKGKILKDGDIVKGASPPRYSLLFTRAKELLVYFNGFLQKSHLNDILKEYSELMKNSESLNKKISEKLPSIKKNTKTLISNLKKIRILYDSKIYEKSKEIFKGFEKNVKNEKIEIINNRFSSQFDRALILKDEGIKIFNINKNNVDKLISDLKKLKIKTEKMKTILDDLNDIVNVGAGNIGLFLNDKEIYDYSRFIMKIIKQESYRYLFPIRHSY